MQAARGISIHISRKKRLKEKETRQRIFYIYGEEVSEALAYLTNKKKETIQQKLNEIISKKLAIEEVSSKLEKEKEEIEKYVDEDPFSNKNKTEIKNVKEDKINKVNKPKDNNKNNQINKNKEKEETLQSTAENKKTKKITDFFKG